MLKKIISIYRVALNLKKEKRAGWNKKDKNGEIINQVTEAESVADHSYGLVVLCLIIGIMRNLNLERLLIMAIMHDLPEGIDGDQITADIADQGLRQKKEDLKKIRERMIIAEIFLELSEDEKNYLIGIFDEYQVNETAEAQLVNQLDKVETILQAIDYAKAGQQVRVQEFVDSYLHRIKDPEMIGLLEKFFDYNKE